MTANLMIQNFWNAAKDCLPAFLSGRGWDCLLPTLRFFLTRQLAPFTTRDGYRIENRQQLLCWWGHAIDHRIYNGWSAGSEETILDVGANYGMFGWECRRRYPSARIVGFEPNAQLAEFCRQLKRNGVAIYDDVICCALSNAKGSSTLYVRSVEGSWTATLDDSQHFDWEPGAAKPTGTLVCSTERLDDFGFHPSIVKIDVDGGELSVADGGLSTLHKSRAVICELAEPRRDKFANLLKRAPIQLTAGDYLFSTTSTSVRSCRPDLVAQMGVLSKALPVIAAQISSLFCKAFPRIQQTSLTQK